MQTIANYNSTSLKVYNWKTQPHLGTQIWLLAMMLTSSLRNSCENCTHTLQRSRLGSRTGFPKLIGCSSWRTMAGPANTLPTTITSRNNACSNFMQDKSFHSSTSPFPRLPHTFISPRATWQRETHRGLQRNAAAALALGKVRHPSHDHTTF